MTKQMLIDATHDEETRVAIVEGYKLLEFDYESKFRKPLKGSIFLAKVTRVEPSLQAAFVNFGGNRHGFLPFSEIHPDYFRIPIADREALMAEQQAMIEEMEKEDELRRQQERERAESEEFGVTGPTDGESADVGPVNAETIEEIRDEEAPIEEIGGTDPGYAAEESKVKSVRGGSRKLDADFAQSMERASGEESFAEDETTDESTDETAMEGDALDEVAGEASYEEAAAGNGEQQSDEQSEGQPGEEGSQGESEGGRDGRSRDNRRGGGGRFRGRGRGRHGHGGGRSHHRVAHSSRRVESFGGEEYDDNGGGDRFRFNLRRKYKIQEVIKRGQIMLVQVSKEERGNKGAAVTSYLSLPGRYCVLMPNSPRAGGVSRKIASYKDRARMREIVQDMDIPKGMSVIVRTAGVARSKEEIQRDLDYLMRLWDNIRELTLQSSAPAIVYEEADLIKRAVRDLYGKDIDDVIVSGQEGYETARNFMKMLMPSHEDRVIHYTSEQMPLFNKYKVEEQIAEIGESQVTLPSGGYMVINQTEALVAIDVNSGRATKERHIEETALKTNMEAAHEVARQLRLRDLGGLVVVDFIDMEDRRNNAKVERKMRDALSTDRARIQMGRISSFGLMELSRQRLNPSLNESQFEVCTHCAGMGRVRTCDATSIMVLRALEEEGIKRNAAQLIAHVSNDVAVYILNNKRKNLSQIESRYGLVVSIRVDDEMAASKFRIETLKTAQAQDDDRMRHDVPGAAADVTPDNGQAPVGSPRSDREEGGNDDSRRRGRRGGRNRGHRPERDGDRNNDRGGDRGGRNFNRNNDNPVSVPFADDDSGFGGTPPAPAGTDDFHEDPDDNRGNREHLNRSREAERGFGGGRGRGDSRGDGRRGGRGGRNNNRGGGRGRDNGPGNQAAPGPRGTQERSNNFGRGRGGFDDGFGEEKFDTTPVTVPVAASPQRTPESEAQPSRNNPRPAAQEPRPSEPRPSEDRSAEHARTFEKVNEPPKEKKRGWWSKG